MKGSFEVFVLPDGAEIRRKLAALRDLPRTASPQQFASVSHELYEMLLGPVASFLPGRRLLIVPDTVLHALPFQMLVTEPLSNTQQEHSQHRSETGSELARISWPRFGRAGYGKKWGNVSFLGRQTIITYAPSASIAAVLRRGPKVSVTTPLTFIGFAPLDWGAAPVRGYHFDALPQTRLELEKIGAMFRSNAVLLFGEAATKAAVISRNLEGFRYIHFATHGFFSALQPEESALVLHPGERGDCLLSAATIMKLRLRADVVGLSACQSAQGRIRYGEGLIGLARAFLYAGARSVCASLWEVADAATAELMTAYYRNLVERGMESAVALQAAQLELMDSSKYGSPYYWAPFILVGG
jgi:CHAT domain-containing protein